MEHGTVSTYTNHGCRCDKCRAAISAYARSRRQRFLSEPIPERIHGTLNGYTNYGCRMECCRAVFVNHNREVRHARKSIIASIEAAQAAER